MSITPTVILRIRKDHIKIYYRIPWGLLHELPLMNRIYYWLASYLYYKKYPFTEIHEMANTFPALKVMLPTLLDTFQQHPSAQIKLIFGAEQ